MEEYIENGLRLGWLIDPEARRVHIYRPGVAIDVLEGVMEVSGEPVLPGFVFDLREIWEPRVRFANLTRLPISSKLTLK